MPQIKFDRIVSCSSEDVAHPATNLLLSKEVNRKWKCKEPGEKSASVIIQLKEPHVITSIDIGNESSSFVEVLVSRTSTPDDFKVILLMSSFMTPMDARGETNRNRVRMFTQKDLSESVQKEKWDRIKVVCTQPFTKHLQYGLSFLILHTADKKEEEKPVLQNSTIKKLGRFVLKEEDVDDIGVGSFFSRRKDFPERRPAILTGAAAVRDASSEANLAKQKGYGKRKIHEHSKEEKNAEISSESVKKKVKTLNKNKNEKRKEEDVSTAAKPNKPKQDELNTRAPSTSKESSSKQSCAPSTSKDSSKQPAKMTNSAKVIFKPFNQLLEGVEIVISGYVNPGRAEVRDKALQMGAKYKPDWCSSSTHLICAFANTPKFQQVKGRGFIVLRDWIDECYKQRKRLPWRKFAVDAADKNGKEDETEIWELTPETKEKNVNADSSKNSRNSLAMKDTRVGSDSNSDSEDEIARIKVKQAMKKNTHLDAGKESDSTNKVALIKKDEKHQKSEEYDGSTDVDSEGEGKKQEMKWMKQKEEDRLTELQYLPDFFKGKTFYLAFDLSEQESISLSRYIVAFGGETSKSTKGSQYVLTRKKDVISLDSEVAPDTLFISPEWVWECNDQNKLVSLEQFQTL